MATLFREKNGYRIQFALSKKRRSIRIGAVPVKVANEIKTKVESLAVSVDSRIPVEQSVAVWVGGIGIKLADRLHKAGLIEKRQDRSTVRFGRIAEWFIDRQASDNPNTIKNYRQVGRILALHFGRDTTMSSITPADADGLASWTRKNYSNATANRLIKFFKQFWRAGISAGAATVNPFEHIKAGKVTNSDRIQYVPQEVVNHLLKFCPDSEWQLILVLARYGGLRIPSELTRLKWRDVDWDNSRIVIDSPKTGARRIPIFREIDVFLKRHHEDTRNRDGHIVSRTRRKAGNLRTMFTKIIRRSGCERWERLFHNLRASRCMEIAQICPMHEYSSVMGHDPKTAMQHYLKMRDGDYAAMVQKAERTIDARNAITRQEAGKVDVIVEKDSRLSPIGESVTDYHYTPQESYKTRKSWELPRVSDELGVNSGAFPPDLARLIAAWPGLPDAVRGRIMGMMEVESNNSHKVTR